MTLDFSRAQLSSAPRHQAHKADFDASGAPSSVTDAPPQGTRAQALQREVTRIWQALLQHERRPAEYPSGGEGRIGLILLALLVLAYVLVIGRYTLLLQDTFQTNGEDLGIMDQVLWTTSHGHLMYQSICNTISDVNCQAGHLRFAIHFEPVLMLLAVLYLVVPSVKLLLLVQVLGFASGAIPVYLLATRRLGHVAWGLLFAVAYLLHPALLAAVTDDFHPETLGAALLMWALYCLWDRRDRTFLVLCVLTLLCKETYTLDVFMVGGFALVAMRRVRLGVGMMVLSLATLAFALWLMHVTSPIGHSPVAERLIPAGQSPLHALIGDLRDPARHLYLKKLLIPLDWLPLLSPWAALLAVPSILLNLVSSNPLMYSAQFQYNTGIVPLLLVAAIDGLAWFVPLLARACAWLRSALVQRRVPLLPRIAYPLTLGVLALALSLPNGMVRNVHQQYYSITHGFLWPSVTAHDRLGEQIAASIPRTASVSAMGTLDPHVSERLHVYYFPDKQYAADYVFLDLSSPIVRPYNDPAPFQADVQQVLRSGTFTLVTARDGYVLLHKRSGPAGTPMTLPPSFYSFPNVPAWLTPYAAQPIP